MLATNTQVSRFIVWQEKKKKCSSLVYFDVPHDTMILAPKYPVCTYVLQM